jgi:hypothetical protein
MTPLPAISFLSLILIASAPQAGTSAQADHAKAKVETGFGAEKPCRVELRVTRAEDGLFLARRTL